MQYIGVKNCFVFFTMWGKWVSKEAEFNVDFKIINLPYLQNAPKKVIQG
jgi:hypothetical protein